MMVLDLRPTKINGISHCRVDHNPNRISGASHRRLDFSQQNLVLIRLMEKLKHRKTIVQRKKDLQKEGVEDLCQLAKINPNGINLLRVALNLNRINGNSQIDKISHSTSRTINNTSNLKTRTTQIKMKVITKICKIHG